MPDIPKPRVRKRTPLGVVPLAAAVGLAACTGVIGDRAADDAPVAIDPTAATLHRLTRAQYTNAIHDLLGADITVPTALEPDVVSSGFAMVGGSIGGISRRGVEQYEAAALKVAKQAMAAGPARDAALGCQPKGTTDDACARSYLASLGKRAFRRPLEGAELDRVAALATQAATTLGDFYQGLVYGMAGLLESPYFLFRPELGVADPAHPGVRRYSGAEMASRLSFFLWNTTPDDELLAAAESGALDREDGLAEQVDRLLASPRAREAVRNFFTERFGLADLDNLSKDTVVYPAMSADLGSSAREETLRVVDELLMAEGGDYRELLTSRRTFVDRKLASLYGVPAPSLEGFGPVELPEGGPRRGLLGHASVLALYAHPTSSSATLRGKFVRRVLLCGVIPSPPANVNTSLTEPDEQKPTLRDRIKIHLSQPFCASCHKSMDPIGLGLENFDGLGQWRTTENGAAIDASGDVDGAAYADAVGLGGAVASHPDLAPCLARHLLRYAGGVPETSGEDAEIGRLARVFADQGYRLPVLLRGVALSPAFRTATENP